MSDNRDERKKCHKRIDRDGLPSTAIARNCDDAERTYQIEIVVNYDVLYDAECIESVAAEHEHGTDPADDIEKFFVLHEIYHTMRLASQKHMRHNTVMLVRNGVTLLQQKQTQSAPGGRVAADQTLLLGGVFC